MKVPALSILASCVALATATAELSLTPKLVTIDFSGTPVKRAYFMDGEKKFAMTMNNETTLEAKGSGAIFRFSKLPQASVELRRSPLPAGMSFDEAGMVKLAKAAREILPQGAEIWLEQPFVTEPFPINDWKSCRFNFVYLVGGTSVRADVTFIDLDPHTQIVVIAADRQGTYGKTRELADDLIRRWHEVTPASELGIN